MRTEKNVEDKLLFSYRVIEDDTLHTAKHQEQEKWCSVVFCSSVQMMKVSDTISEHYRPLCAVPTNLDSNEVVSFLLCYSQ